MKYFFDQKLQFTYSQASLQDVQAAEAFSTSKHAFFFFFFFVGHFYLLDPDPDSYSGYGSTDLIESGSNRKFYFYFR
jgi:hypothetical protein